MAYCRDHKCRFSAFRNPVNYKYSPLTEIVKSGPAKVVGKIPVSE
jgi:hypothetical protein